MDFRPFAFDKIPQVLPILRLPLLLNNVVAIIPSFVGCGHFNFQKEGSFMLVSLVLAITFITSLLVNIFALWKIRRGQRLQLGSELDAQSFTPYLAVVESGLAVAFLLLFILETIGASTSYETQVARLFAGFGAVIAFSIHTSLSLIPMRTWMRNFRVPRPKCPTCHRKMKVQRQITAQPARDIKTPLLDTHSYANEEGVTEGDRLIVPGPNE